MALERTPLTDEQLSDAAKKVLGAGPMKMMAAKGLAPLPRAGDMVTVLYQLSLDDDEKVRTAAGETFKGLPQKIVAGALADGALDPRVLAALGGRAAEELSLFEALLLNPATADETIADLTKNATRDQVELVGQAEERLLRYPRIVAEMYMNASARMSTVDRAVELAVRNDIKVPGIPAWSEVVAAIMGQDDQPQAEATPADDSLWEAAAEKTVGDTEEAKAALASQAPPEEEEVAEERQVPIERLPIPHKMRLAQTGNAFARSVLVQDRNKLVAMAVIKSPQITDNEVVKYSASKTVVDEVISYISGKREYLKLYAVKSNLVNNPKTPLRVAMRLVPHLNDRDLKILARSKNIPSALRNQIKGLMQAKMGNRKK